jgi:hypothetical protein
VVSHQPLNDEALIQSQVSPCEVCGTEYHWARFFSEYLSFTLSSILSTHHTHSPIPPPSIGIIQNVPRGICHIRGEYAPQVSLHQHNLTCLYPKLTWRKHSLLAAPRTITVLYDLTCTLCMSIYKPVAKPRQANPYIGQFMSWQKFGNLRTTFTNIVQLCLSHLMSLYHSNVNQMYSTGVKNTDTSNSSSF